MGPDDLPDVLYAASGDGHIAYQVWGEGPLDLVVVPGFFSHLELMWENESAARFLRQLGTFARVVFFDRRGSGLSDPLAAAPTLEERIDDILAVMDATSCERPSLLAISEGAPTALLLAATHPARVRSMVFYAGLARSTWAEDYTWAPPIEAFVEANAELVVPFWGRGATIEVAAPSMADDPAARRHSARMERMSASPATFMALGAMFLDIDVRDVARTVRTPTLLLHRTQDALVNVRHSRWLAANMPDARLVELPGGDHVFFYGDSDAVLGATQEFLTGVRPVAEPERALATIVFTDIVDSTRTASRLGDQAWRGLLADHQNAADAAVRRARGRTVKWLGDGLMATFDGPASAIRCAQAIVTDAEARDFEVRAGVHTGEVELMGDDLAGIAVHIAARVSSLSGPGEVLVSRTVRDLVAGSGLSFTDRGTHELKGVTDRWTLYAASASVSPITG